MTAGALVRPEGNTVETSGPLSVERPPAAPRPRVRGPIALLLALAAVAGVAFAWLRPHAPRVRPAASS
jgi:hypothetical protein